MSHIDSLIIVCCHAIWLGGPTGGEDESEWLIESFQVGETPTFVQHARAGLEALAGNERAILVFSGGPTKQAKTALSEAQSYRNLALAHSLLRSIATPLSGRIFTDTYATDSFQNVLFPLLQFPLYTSTLADGTTADNTISPFPRTSSSPPSNFSTPAHLTLVSHDFKRARFTDLHLPALRYPTTTTGPADSRTPSNRFTFTGIDPPFSAAQVAAMREGDRRRGYGAWARDLYAAAGGELEGKRRARGWGDDRRREFDERVVESIRDPSARQVVQSLMAWQGGADGVELFRGKMPWME